MERSNGANQGIDNQFLTLLRKVDRLEFAVLRDPHNFALQIELRAAKEALFAFAAANPDF